MKFTKENIKEYASKLLIDLTDEEVNNLTNEFDEIDNDMNKLNNIKDLEKQEPMHMVPFEEEVILREDEVEPSLSKNEVLKNSDDTLDEEVRVPKVVN